jgi:hypothetical protein
MKQPTRSVVQIGDLVAAVFDSAAQYSVDPRVVSRLATRALGHLLRQAPGPGPVHPIRLSALHA